MVNPSMFQLSSCSNAPGCEIIRIFTPLTVHALTVQLGFWNVTLRELLLWFPNAPHTCCNSTSPARHQPVDEMTVDHDLTRGDPVDRGDEFVQIADALFQQVPDSM